MIKLSIVIPVYNKFAFTKSALQDLSKLSSDNEIIIVDNETDEDNSVDYLRSLSKYNNIKIIKCSDINLDTANKCAKTYNIEAV